MPKERYLSPIEMAFSPDGRRLYVVCQGSDELRVLDMASGKLVKQHSRGPRSARTFAFRRRQADVRHQSWADTVSVIDTDTLDSDRRRCRPASSPSASSPIAKARTSTSPTA